ncbi:MAG TPA: hypothetical protein VEG39_00475 [Clostridia bacterium]|nr:hypothetical protein [Clostridia bacterium]
MVYSKKIMSLIMVGIILVCLLPAPVDAASKSIGIDTNVYNDEIQRAINLGIVPDDMLADYTKNVTHKQVYTLLNNCIKLKTGNYNADWSKLTDAADSRKPVNRQQTAEIVYKAAKLLEDTSKVWYTNALYFSADKLDQELVKAYIKECNPTYTDILPLDFMQVVRTMKEYSEYDFSLNADKTGYSQEKADAIDYVTKKSDSISGKKIMELTQDYRFRPKDNTTNAEAIIAAYRLYNGIDEKPEYVKLEAVGPNTVPAELLTKECTLPDASNNKLPQWKGVGITNKGGALAGALFQNENRNFHENEIKFLSENGFNFVRVFFSFSTLGYPDYEKGIVNETELRELDKLIAWGMKYNVHICICMYGQPELGKEPWPTEITTGDFFTNVQKQKNAKDYWRMLSRRYANIPNRYLSFNLMNEPEPPSDEVQTAVFKPIVEAIWEECPGRVIIADCTGASCEGLAKLGVALSYHLYVPNTICYNGLDFMREAFPYLETPQWPMVYLPGLLDSGADRDSVIIEGSFDKGSIGIYVDGIAKDSDATLAISADGKNILQEKVIGTSQSDNWGKIIRKEYAAEFAAGTTKLEIKVSGWLRYGRIQIKQPGKKDINMYPHDIYCYEWNAVAPKILVHNDGSFENNNSPRKMVDGDYIYQWAVKEHQAVAEKYNVGFMIGEFGPFGETLPKATLLAYMDTILGGLSSNGLGWCNGGFIGSGYIATFAPYSDEYRFSKLSDSDLYINDELFSIYKEHTK